MTKPSSLVIIGAGPGGYTAAFHAADLGLSVTLIDDSPAIGGTCLNKGCIPSKALLHAAKTLSDATHAKTIGITFATPSVDVERLRAWKDGIVTKLTGGLAQLAKARKVTLIQGTARFLSSSTLDIQKSDGTNEALSFDKAIIAAGSSPIRLPSFPESTRIWDSTQALTLPFIPTSLLVIGGGYIGLELGSAYAGLGSKVSLVEALPELLPGADKDLADILLRRLKKTFVKTLTGTVVTKAEETPDGIRVTFKNPKGQETMEIFSHILVSVGRRPNTADLGLHNTKMTLSDKGFINVNRLGQSDDQNIYAIGDVTGNPMLAHKASFEAKVAVEAIAGMEKAKKSPTIPSVIFTDPELAWCGLTEKEAAAQGLSVTVSKFPWAASGRAMTLERTDGLTKVIADSKTERILGVGIVGIGAGDLISEGTLAVEKGLTAKDLSLTIHPHPTLSETLMESSEGLFGHPTHILKK